MKILTRHLHTDQLGIIAAVSCAIHCAALPLIFTSLPLVGMEFLANIWVEITMVCVSALLGCYSLTKSYPKHKNILPFMLLFTGFALIALGHFILESTEAILVPLGGLCIAMSHFINWKKLKKCAHQHNEKTKSALNKL